MKTRKATRKITIGARVPEFLKEDILKYCEEHKINTSELITRLLAEKFGWEYVPEHFKKIKSVKGEDLLGTLTLIH